MPALKPPIYLSDNDLESLGIQPRDIADAIETTLDAQAKGRFHPSPKTAIRPGDGRYAMSTLAMGDDGFIVIKQVTVCPENPGKGLAAINGAIMVLDAQTGILRAVLDANWITAVRTAALSVVAARRLADPTAQSVAFVGTGVQARSHLNALADEFPLEHIHVVGRGKPNIDLLCDQAQALGLHSTVHRDPQEALQQADLIVTSVTLDNTITPFLNARWLKPNAFAAITDACVPWIPESLTAFKTLIVDDRIQEKQNPQPMLPYDHITGDLAELVTAQDTGQDTGQFTQTPKAFAFRGLALGDYAAAVLAVKRAAASGLSPTFPT